jgi:DNA polymerase-4
VVRRVVTADTGLSCSVGIGDNKLRAKLATGFAKPAGIYRLTRENWVAVMAHRPTESLWGIGRKTATKLSELGLHTVEDLARADVEVLAARFGPATGPWLRNLALGAGDAEVSSTPWIAKSHSRETTFQRDLTDPAQITAEIITLTHRVAQDVTTEARPATRLAIKIRYAPFFTQTRSMTLPTPTTNPPDLEQAALDLLTKFDLTRPIRLLGIRAEF